MSRSLDMPAWGWVEVYVEPHDALPDGASMRFKALNEPQALSQVHYESDDGDEGLWRIWSPTASGGQESALTCLTDDSGAGQSALIYGGELGLRLELLEGPNKGVVVAEAWILLAPEDALAQ